MLLKGLEGWHLLIIAGLVAVLFGSRRMPGAARSIGQSLRIFKSEMKAAHEDGAAPPSVLAEHGSTVTPPQLIDAPVYPVSRASAAAAASASVPASASTPAP